MKANHYQILDAIARDAQAGVEKGYDRIDGHACELEVLEMLYALVRCIKPDLVIESGTGKGYSAKAILSGLMANGEGKLVTFEPDRRLRLQAINQLQGNVEVRTGFALDCDEPMPDMVFLDSRGKRREEIIYWSERPVFLIRHDAWKFQELVEGGFYLQTARQLWFKDQR